jgi:hypothetical protein
MQGDLGKLRLKGSAPKGMKKLLSDDSRIGKDDVFGSFQPLRIKYTPTRRASIGATKNRISYYSYLGVYRHSVCKGVAGSPPGLPEPRQSDDRNQPAGEP